MPQGANSEGPAKGDVSIRERFRRFAHGTSQAMGSPWAFMAAALIIVVWAITGPIYKYSNTWQLVINTGTTIITFLMVFLIQSTQNRDTRAVHLKLDELIRAVKGARNKLVNLEEMSDEELDVLHDQFQKVCGARKAREGEKKSDRREDVSSPQVSSPKEVLARI